MIQVIGAGVAAAIAVFVTGAFYALLCVLLPLTHCMWCVGKLRPTGAAGCRWCGGSGLRLRVGRRAWNALFRLSQDTR